MTNQIQTLLLNEVKTRLGENETLATALSEVLNIGMDAAYRRNRIDTYLTIDEVYKICRHYSISFDAICGMNENSVMFEYNPLHYYDFSLETYLEGMVDALRRLHTCTDPRIMLTSNNIAVFQLLNFPRLSRFRLYFWAKTHLHVEEYKDQKFKEERVTNRAFELGAEILDLYVKTPSIECYDTEFLKGLIRQILYYSNAHLFENPEFALKLMDDVGEMAEHIRQQTILGAKFKHRDDPDNIGNTYDVYLNDTINSDNTFYYHSKEVEGIYISHNQMNYLHTTDKTYVKESRSILEKQIANSSIISKVNEKERNNFYHRIEKSIEMARVQILANIEAQSA